MYHYDPELSPDPGIYDNRTDCKGTKNDRNQASQGKRFSIDDIIETKHNVSAMRIGTDNIKFW
jgi:hypothetical protein